MTKKESVDQKKNITMKAATIVINEVRNIIIDELNNSCGDDPARTNQFMKVILISFEDILMHFAMSKSYNPYDEKNISKVISEYEKRYKLFLSEIEVEIRGFSFRFLHVVPIV